MDGGMRRLPDDRRMRAANLFVQGLAGSDEAEARQAVQAAVDLMERMREEGEPAERDLALVGMESCLKVGLVERASALADSLLDDQRAASGEVHATTAAAVSRAFQAAGVKDTADAIFERTRREMAAVNNEAVALAQQGRLREAMGLFIRAAAGKSAAAVAIINAIQAVLAVFDQDGWDESLARELEILFERGEEKDPANPKLANCHQRRRELMQKYGIRADQKAGSALKSDDDVLAAIGL
jgi:hypothetical protein